MVFGDDFADESVLVSFGGDGEVSGVAEVVDMSPEDIEAEGVEGGDGDLIGDGS